MAWEIERRFLVRVPDALRRRAEEGNRLRQGYIRLGEPTVRIRIGEPRGAVLNCKSGRGIRRKEEEIVVPDALAQLLLEAAEDRVIEKIRWTVDGWDLDRFLGPLEGLMLMEAELDSERQPVPPVPADIKMLREVTDDMRFTSSHLAGMTPSEQTTFVTTVYKEVEG